LRLAVVSPFLDRQHGTELCIIEQIERFAHNDQWTIELYSQRVSQLDVRPASSSSASGSDPISWHKISDIPGPHLLKYLWWFFANQWQRSQDRRARRAKPDLVYSPGINCRDADVIAVHILFHALYESLRPELALGRAPLASWPRLLHRKLYYRLLMFLESKIYSDRRVSLIAVSTRIARKLEAYFGRSEVTVILNAVDTKRFAPETRLAKRGDSRKNLGFGGDDFVVLLIGNDWKNKGLDVLLRATASLQDLPVRLLVVGDDEPALYTSAIRELDLPKRVVFSKPSPDVLPFYAAADLYAGPSMEDSFSLPIAEAMACGLVAIASVNAGASELICHGENGMLLRVPTDAAELAALIRKAATEAELWQRLGIAAARTIQTHCSWERNTAATREFLENVLASRGKQPGI
jgi:glycosyltransferase involved in cell wall biosynthesis